MGPLAERNAHLRLAPVKALKSPTGSPRIPELAENAERSIHVTFCFVFSNL